MTGKEQMTLTEIHGISIKHKKKKANKPHLTVRVIKHQNRLPRETVESPSGNIQNPHWTQS